MTKTFAEVRIGAAFTWGAMGDIFTKISDVAAVRSNHVTIQSIGRVYSFAPHCKVND